jgi:hypothetical protein
VTDDADRADEIIAQTVADALESARRNVGPLATGRCLWCDDPVAEGRRWCGPECRSEWDLYHAAENRR